MRGDIKKKIVLIENDGAAASSTADYLKERGFDVTVLPSSEKYAEFAASAPRIDLVLYDVDPEKDTSWIDASEKITALQDIPVVFLTSLEDGDTLSRISSVERYGFAVKSSGNPGILSSVNMALRLFDSARVLRDSEENYKFLADNATDIIVKLDANAKIIYISPFCKLVLGYDPEELVGNSVLHYYEKEDRILLFEAYDRIMEFSGIYTFNHRMTLKDGSYKWFESTSKKLINADGIVIGIMSSSRDITQRVEAEKALRDSDEKLHLVMDGVPALLAYIDTDERFVYVNEGYVRWYGIPKENIVGKHVREIFSPDEYAKASFYFPNNQAGESAVAESFTYDKNGDEKYVRGYFIPHKSDGVVHGFFSLLFDITEIKQAEQKILSLLNEKDMLLKEVHHRVKNNMGSIAALLYLQMDSMDNPAAVNAIQDARSRVMSMMGIYNILYRSGEYRSVPARSYFSDLIEKISITYITSKRVKIESEIDEMVLDSGILFPLGMIVNELLTNAVKYAFTGDRPGEIKVSIAKKDDKHIEIVIKDNGIGLPDALEISSSRGIGLTLVKMMIQQIKGSIKINKVGGTEFRINFPVAGKN